MVEEGSGRKVPKAETTAAAAATALAAPPDPNPPTAPTPACSGAHLPPPHAQPTPQWTNSSPRTSILAYKRLAGFPLGEGGVWAVDKSKPRSVLWLGME